MNIKKKTLAWKTLINDSVVVCDRTADMPEIESINSSDIIPTY